MYIYIYTHKKVVWHYVFPKNFPKSLYQMRYVYTKISVTQSQIYTCNIHVTLPAWTYSQNESFWFLSIPEKPKPSGTMIGSVSATRSYFSQTDFFPYFSNWSSAYERHYQRGITRHNELRNEETKKVNRIFLKSFSLLYTNTRTYTHRRNVGREK